MADDISSPIPADKLALRPREAARLLSVSPRTLWAMTRDRRVPHIKIGRSVLYPVDALKQWLIEQSAK